MVKVARISKFDKTVEYRRVIIVYFKVSDQQKRFKARQKFWRFGYSCFSSLSLLSKCVVCCTKRNKLRNIRIFHVTWIMLILRSSKHIYELEY